MTDLVEQLKIKRFRGSTLKNYYPAWKTFNEFVIRLDLKPNNWGDRIILFVSYIIKNGRKATTIKSYVSAIRALLRNIGYELNEDKFWLNAMTKAGKLVNERVCTRFPTQKPMLKTLVRTLRQVFSDQPYLMKLYAGMLSIAYFGLFQVSEIAAGGHPVLARDVHVGKNKKKLLLVLRTSKTHGKNCKPQTVKLSSTATSNYTKDRSKDNSIICPYRNVNAFAEVRPGLQHCTEQFFCIQ